MSICIYQCKSQQKKKEKKMDTSWNEFSVMLNQGKKVVGQDVVALIS